MDFKGLLWFFVLLLVVLSQHIYAFKAPSYNQNIDQQIKGALQSNVDQNIRQDILNDCRKNEGTINQNIKQDVMSEGGKSESINQNIEQKIQNGCNCIEHKTFREIKNHEKRSNRPYNFEDIIFRRHHKNCGPQYDSSEEIKICNDDQSSEIVIKNHEDCSDNVSEDSNEEIVIKYGKKPCKDHTSEEIVLPEPEKHCLIPKPLKKKVQCFPQFRINPYLKDSSEEVKKPCVVTEKPKPVNCKKFKDISSGENIKKPYRFEESSEEYLKPNPCGCRPIISSEESSEEQPCFKKRPISFESFELPKSCGCNICRKSEESVQSSEEEILVKPCFKSVQKPCVKPKPCACKTSSSEEIHSQSVQSSEEEILIKPCFKPVQKPCVKPKPCKTCSSEEILSESSEESYKPKKKIIYFSSESQESEVGPIKSRPVDVSSAGIDEDSSEEFYPFSPLYRSKPVVVKPCPRGPKKSRGQRRE